MANLFYNLDVPAGNGVGAPTDIDEMGNPKTLEIAGSFGGGITIEVSLDDGGTWLPVWTFTTDPEKKVIRFAGNKIRVRRTGVPLVAAGLPKVSVSANNFGTKVRSLPPNTPVDISDLGNDKTFTVFQLPVHGSINIEASEDGVNNWSPCLTFGNNDINYKQFISKFIRARGSAGAIVNVAAINDGGGGEDTDELVKVSANDDVAGYLEEKLVEGLGIDLAVLNEDGDEDVQISADVGEIQDNLLFGNPITVRGPTNAPGDSGLVNHSNHDHRLEYEVEDEGILVSARPRMDFVGDGVGAVDVPGEDLTRVTIPGPNLGDGGAVVKRSTYVEAERTVSQTVYQDGMIAVTVPINGDYLVIFEGEGANQSNGIQVEIAVSVNNAGPGGAVVAGSERLSEGNASDLRPLVTSVQIVGAIAGDIVRILFKRVGGGGMQTVSMFRRHLSIIKVQ